MRDKTTDDICELLDIDESTLKRWVAAGLPCNTNGKKSRKFDEGEVAAWMKTNRKTGKPGRPQTEDGKEFMAAKIRKENALATRYEIEIDQIRGKLLNKSDVESSNVQKVSALRNGLLSLPASLAPGLEGLGAAEIQAEIEGAVKNLLEQFSKG